MNDEISIMAQELAFRLKELSQDERDNIFGAFFGWLFSQKVTQ